MTRLGHSMVTLGLTKFISKTLDLMAQIKVKVINLQ